MPKKMLDAPFEIKKLQEDGSFEGYGSVFNVADSDSEVIVPGAFKNSLLRWNAKGRKPPLLWQHQQQEPIGVFTDLGEDAKGLRVAGQLVLESQRGAEAYALLKAGAVTGLSIGFQDVPGGSDYDRKRGVRVIKDLNLWEVSLVTFPANDEARIGAVKASFRSGEVPHVRVLETALREELGFSHKQAKAFISGGYKALVPIDAAESLGAIGSLIAKLKGRK
jgi:HK97 family phage prohead protease